MKEWVNIKDEILKRGYVDVKVSVSGLRQSHRLELVREVTSQGLVPFLVCRHYIPASELLRLAEQLHLPVKYKTTVAFPPGKRAGDFAERNDSGVSIEADTIEAEIEEDESGDSNQASF
ncbi:hypothetical protein KKF81_00785 [Candidatus Micrarchaeota archaeon]|nr:hypothetical protein [Candidatus Micrarchaeota archaeon]MBU1887436.1 hypothetical protein [Candidatus Micrarchaeota archaeon]